MRRNISILLLLLFTFSSLNAQWIWNIERMNEIKRNINSPKYSSAYLKLIDDANEKLAKEPYSVTFKENIAPSGDKHDYVSLSRYVWPDPTQPDGLPYITRDGESNPELEKYDRNPLGNMANDVNTLALAYFYSNNEIYAAKAVTLLKTWFLNKETRMNPNLNYAQFIPGRNDSKGRSFGLIDTYSFVDLINSIQLLHSSNSYTTNDSKQLKEWFRDFTHWWQTSEQGIAENNAKNNHGLAYDVQLALFALFSDNMDTALQVINDFPEKRLFPHIAPDGSQPLELTRTLSFHYSEYNITHMIDLFAIANSLDIKLIDVESEDGRSFYKAIDFLTPYLGKKVNDWPYQQISGWEQTLQNLCDDLYRIVAIDPSQKEYLELYNQHSRNNTDSRIRLMYGALE